ncbi:hypothetical protein C8R44DRAFT_749007 [Mycena epipterygia]|nr:hypothetical protein C8R44DRAFT_749007 [Mycena epipterygia]
MSSNSRKQITYAHKRNRSKPSRIISASSPLHEPEDSDSYMPHTELSPRLLKRARRSSNPEVFSSKKIKASAVTPAGSPSQFETPYPSALTEEQKFKLNSSRGLPMHPDQFSPLPAARPVIPRTASKENRSRRLPKKDASLDSPFNSRPNSARSSPQKRTFSSQPTQKLSKRTLSDTKYSSNIPQSASTANSPTRAHSPVRSRRPSAPSPPRPGTWMPKEKNIGSFDFDFHSALVNPFFLPSATNDIDFNRPPSSLSFYGDSDLQLFDDGQVFSTPETVKRAYTLGSDVAEYDENFPYDGDREPDLTMTQDTMDVDLAYGMKALPMRERSPWLSDSLISPPVSQEWKRHPKEGAYTHSTSEDIEMYDDISHGLGVQFAPLVLSEEDDADAAAPVLRTDGKTRDDDLKQMFDGLALVPQNRYFNNRTRSLDSSNPASTEDDVNVKPKGRDRRGTIRASDFSKVAASARRTRSGTVIGPPAPVPRARSLETGSIGEVNEDEELNGWCADGWAVAAPPSPVVSRKSHPRMVRDAQAHSPVGFAGTVKGFGLLPSPVLQRKSRKGKGREVVLEEDEEDELLLRPGFNVWE